MADILDEDGKPVFQVTGNGRAKVDWRDLAEEHRQLAEKSGFPRDFSEIEIAQRYGVEVAEIRDRARARGLGRRRGPVWFFTPEEATIGLWEEEAPASETKRRGPSRFKERDITRAFKAAKKAGVDVRIGVAPDGKMSIDPVESEDGQEQNNPWDEILDTPKTSVRPRLS